MVGSNKDDVFVLGGGIFGLIVWLWLLFFKIGAWVL